MFGAQVLYNVLLCRESARRCGVTTDDLAAALQEQHGDWVDEMTENGVELADWWSRPDLFWRAVATAGARVRYGTRTFLDRWLTAAIADPDRVMHDGRLAGQLVAHEFALKGRYARLSNLAALQAWRGDPLGGGRLVYRWTTTQRLLADLADGLAGGVTDARA
jgi:hypothetical protein